MTATMEPIGHLTFQPPEGKPIAAKSTWEDWARNARCEFALSRAILPILNASDVELEALVRAADDPEKYMLLVETCQEYGERYKAGVEVYDSVFARLLIVLERVHGCDGVAEPAKLPAGRVL